MAIFRKYDIIDVNSKIKNDQNNEVHNQNNGMAYNQNNKSLALVVYDSSNKR
jgi:hypothetical protein